MKHTNQYKIIQKKERKMNNVHKEMTHKIINASS